jgi:hypothetical protein
MSAPNQSNVAIIRVTETTRFDAAGRALRLNLISYMVGEDGPFTLEVSPQNNNAAWIDQQIADNVALLAAIRGRE